MNYNQNQKLNQLDEGILIIGIDVSKKFHVARAQDFRGVEFRKGIKFDNTLEGFQQFCVWKDLLMKEETKTKVIVGMEPTGPYWLSICKMAAVARILDGNCKSGTCKEEQGTR